MFFSLPFPISTNANMTRTRYGMMLSKRAKAYRAEVVAQMHEKKLYNYKMGDFLELSLVYFPPDDGRVRDVDNYQKSLFDALTHSGFWIDDRQVKAYSVKWGAPKGSGRVEIMVMVIDKPYW